MQLLHVNNNSHLPIISNANFSGDFCQPTNFPSTRSTFIAQFLFKCAAEDGIISCSYLLFSSLFQ